jgi:hypothetical protein
MEIHDEGANAAENDALARMNGLADQIKAATGEIKHAAVERNIDKILKVELEKYAEGEAKAAKCAALQLATHRLERLISRRRAGLYDRSRASKNYGDYRDIVPRRIIADAGVFPSG